MLNIDLCVAGEERSREDTHTEQEKGQIYIHVRTESAARKSYQGKL